MSSDLSRHLENTLSSDYKVRTDATNALIQASHASGYGIALLHVLASPSLPIPIRQSAAITFKNYVTKHWHTSTQDDDDKDTHITISDADRQLIKDNIIQLMLSIDIRSIQIQLSAALAVIASYDFPEH
jgi:exportin-2 (importin alpha re-exporter)